MALKGDLRSIQLADVFQMLTLSQKTGTLEIHADASRMGLYFNGSGVLYPYHPETFAEKVHRVLIRRGELTPADLENARYHAGQSGGTTLETMLQTGTVNQAQVDAAFRTQMEEEVYDLFFVREATFEFKEGQAPQADGRVLEERLVLPANSIVMEAARRIDEWQHIGEKVPSDQCVFQPAVEIDALPPLEDGLPGQEVFAWLNGERSVEAIVEGTGLSRFVVCKTLAQMVRERAVYEAQASELVERAEKQISAGEPAAALPLLERAFELGIGELDAHEMAAQAYEACGRVGRACYHLGQHAAALREGGELAATVEMFFKIRQAMPTDLTSREQLIELYLENDGLFRSVDFDVVEETAELAWILKSVGRAEDARHTLVEVQSRFLDQYRVTTQFAQVCVDLAEARTAVEMLESAADSFLASRNFTPALRLYRRIRAIAPNHDGLDGKIEVCSQAEERARPRHWQKLRLAVLVLLFGGASAAYLRYSQQAVNRYRELNPEELVLQGEYEGAITMLERFQERHPATLASFVASRKLRELGSRQKDYGEFLLEAEESERLERELNQRRAERHYAEALKKIHEGEYPAALGLLHKADELASDAGWRQEEGLQSKTAEIEEYLEKSGALYAEFMRLREQDFRAAHKVGVSLLKEYPLSPQAAELSLPLRIETRPPGALLSWGGDPRESEERHQATTPVLLDVPAGQTVFLSLEREGYHLHEQRLDPVTQSEVVVTLERRAGRTMELSDPPCFAPVFVDDMILVGSNNGRVHALDADGNPRWQVTLPDLELLAAPPLPYQDAVIAVGTQGRAFLLARDSGEELRRIDFGAPPVGPFAVYRGVLVGTVGNVEKTELVCHNVEDGQHRWSQPLPGPPALGPVACREGFAVADEAGRVLRLDGRNGQLLDRWTVSGKPCALAVDDADLFVGTDSGVLSCLRVEQELAVWQRQLPAAPGEIHVDRHQVRARGGEKLYLLQRVDGAAAGPVQPCGSGALAHGADFVAVADQRVVLIHELAHATPRARFRLEAAVHSLILTSAAIWALDTNGHLHQLTVNE